MCSSVLKCTSFFSPLLALYIGIILFHGNMVQNCSFRKCENSIRGAVLKLGNGLPTILIRVFPWKGAGCDIKLSMTASVQCTDV